MERLKWVLIAMPLVAAAIGVGVLKGKVVDNEKRIESLERKLDERSMDIQATGAGRLILEKLNAMDKRLDRIEAAVDRVEAKQRSGYR